LSGDIHFSLKARRHKSTESHALLSIKIISISADIIRFTHILMKHLSHAPGYPILVT